MEQGQSRLCPRCGTPRIGSFRWCRSCQYDFDELRASTRPAPRPFELDPPGMAAPAPHVIPAPQLATEPGAAAGTPETTRAAPGRGRTQVPPIVIVAVVGVFSLVAIGLAALLVPSPAPTGAGSGPSSEPTATATSSAATSSAEPADGPTAADESTVSGQGSDVAAFAFPDSTGIATIEHEGPGPFAVWTVGADGAKQGQLVDAAGPYVGTRRFAAQDGNVAFAVESDGNWSITVAPFSAARTWNATDRLIGDGDDVVLVFPPTRREVRVTVISDGAIAVAAFAGAGRQPILNEAGAYRGEVALPAGTSVLEIEAGAGWSIAPQ